MIVYGYRAKALAERQLPEAICSKCGESGKTMAIAQNYAHIFWFPFFPLNRYSATICHHCQSIEKKKFYDEQMLSEYDDLRQEASMPPYLFAGTVILLSLIGFFMIKGYKKDQNTNEYISAPQAGDVYILKSDDGAYPYTVTKVINVTSDSVDILYSKWSYNLASGCSDDIHEGKLLDTAYFENSMYYTAAIADLTEWKESGFLHYAQRD